ncbi:hypothetical protein AVEN_143578-1 [Araneus ventricosus]|uniref:Uncharacterized protein n=1 Tax=Araneus ventricosus TaxID=182803 RepID=A0A4Y2ANE5_ARAVE|nr:hypothetical protein AVEN_143578-1 [Araneus ventricosus]
MSDSIDLIAKLLKCSCSNVHFKAKWHEFLNGLIIDVKVAGGGMPFYAMSGNPLVHPIFTLGALRAPSIMQAAAPPLGRRRKHFGRPPSSLMGRPSHEFF